MHIILLLVLGLSKAPTGFSEDNLFWVAARDHRWPTGIYGGLLPVSDQGLGVNLFDFQVTTTKETYGSIRLIRASYDKKTSTILLVPETYGSTASLIQYDLHSKTTKLLIDANLISPYIRESRIDVKNVNFAQHDSKIYMVIAYSEESSEKIIYQVELRQLMLELCNQTFPVTEDNENFDILRCSQKIGKIYRHEESITAIAEERIEVIEGPTFKINQKTSRRNDIEFYFVTYNYTSGKGYDLKNKSITFNRMGITGNRQMLYHFQPQSHHMINKDVPGMDITGKLICLSTYEKIICIEQQPAIQEANSTLPKFTTVAQKDEETIFLCQDEFSGYGDIAIDASSSLKEARIYFSCTNWHAAGLLVSGLVDDKPKLGTTMRNQTEQGITERFERRKTSATTRQVEVHPVISEQFNISDYEVENFVYIRPKELFLVRSKAAEVMNSTDYSDSQIDDRKIYTTLNEKSTTYSSPTTNQPENVVSQPVDFTLATEIATITPKETTTSMDQFSLFTTGAAEQMTTETHIEKTTPVNQFSRMSSSLGTKIYTETNLNTNIQTQKISAERAIYEATTKKSTQEEALISTTKDSNQEPHANITTKPINENNKFRTTSITADFLTSDMKQSINELKVTTLKQETRVPFQNSNLPTKSNQADNEKTKISNTNNATTEIVPKSKEKPNSNFQKVVNKSNMMVPNSIANFMFTAFLCNAYLYVNYVLAPILS